MKYNKDGEKYCSNCLQTDRFNYAINKEPSKASKLI